jgi:hypothetical protein
VSVPVVCLVPNPLGKSWSLVGLGKLTRDWTLMSAFGQLGMGIYSIHVGYSR